MQSWLNIILGLLLLLGKRGVPAGLLYSNSALSLKEGLDGFIDKAPYYSVANLQCDYRVGETAQLAYMTEMYSIPD